MWNYLPRLAVGFALVAAATTSTIVGELVEPKPGPGSLPAPYTDPDQAAREIMPRVEMVDLTDDLEDLAIWAVDLFDAAGLELPPLRFQYHEGGVACHGRTGSHTRSGEVSVLNLCTSDVGRATEVMVLHETAHAWTVHFLDDSRRAAFKELRGWEHWHDYEAAPWHENGVEQAAEFLVWGLLDRPYAMVRMYHSGCDELEAGYRALTGRAPLHGFRDLC